MGDVDARAAAMAPVQGCRLVAANDADAATEPATVRAVYGAADGPAQSERSMRGFVVSTVVTAIAVWITVQLLPDFLSYDGEPVGLLVVALVFGLVNGLIKPIVRLLTLPIRLATMGVLGFAINVAAFLLVAWVSGQLGVDFRVGGFPPDLTADSLIGAVIGGFVLSLVSTVVGFAVPD